jgi:hypothetical protein
MSRQRDLGGAVRSTAAEGSPPVKRNLHALSAPDLRGTVDNCPDADPRLVHSVHCGPTRTGASIISQELRGTVIEPEPPATTVKEGRESL